MKGSAKTKYYKKLSYSILAFVISFDSIDFCPQVLYLLLLVIFQ